VGRVARVGDDQNTYIMQFPGAKQLTPDMIYAMDCLYAGLATLVGMLATQSDEKSSPKKSGPSFPQSNSQDKGSKNG
jgi:hypothetical protein